LFPRLQNGNGPVRAEDPLSLLEKIVEARKALPALRQPSRLRAFESAPDGRGGARDGEDRPEILRPERPALDRRQGRGHILDPGQRQPPVPDAEGPDLRRFFEERPHGGLVAGGREKCNRPAAGLGSGE